MKSNSGGTSLIFNGSLNKIETLKFFHCLVKERRKRMQLKRIRKQDGSWAEGDDQIASEAVLYF